MISLQQYRVSIGTFNRTQCRQRKDNILNKSDKKLFGILLLSLLMISMLGVVIIQSKELIYPTSSGINSFTYL